MAIQTIVTAFDFSEPASRALRWAGTFARASHARLEVVHVYPDFEDRSQGERAAPWPQADQVERYLRFLEQELREVATSLLGAEGPSVGVRVVRGDPVKCLLATAEELHADLIVLGATGKGRAARMMLGSVSEYVLRSSHIPVAILH